jgi:hypothetical protein
LNHAFGPYACPTAEYPDYAQVASPVSEQACQEACWLAHSMLLGEHSDLLDIVEAVDKIYQHHLELL